MAKAAWAARSQLLSRLVPFADPRAATFGLAPAALVPEVCGHLRALSAQDLRLALAAFSRQPSDSPDFQVAASGQPSRRWQAEGKPAPLAEALVELLIGGSRLASTENLLGAAESVALHAPCDCRAASDFWTVFAERVSRLTSRNELDGPGLRAVFSSGAAWRTRCGCASKAGRGGPDPNRATGGPWGHMVRSAGGRLAEAELLEALPIHDVVQLARDAAKLEEPQSRLAAAIGHRVNMGAKTQLTADEIVDLIGAAGQIGGRLHMMTRSLADALEPQIPKLPTKMLVKLVSHLGALNMFPRKLTQSLERPLARLAGRLDVEDALSVLRAFGRLRWRLPRVLDPLLGKLKQPQCLDGLNGSELAAILYELYRLDVWEEALMEDLLLRLDAAAAASPLPRKRASNVLLALCYFSRAEPGLIKRLLQELMRTQELPNEAVFQVKTFEMALRVGHLSGLETEDLGKLATQWLFQMRAMTTPPEVQSESTFADDVSAAATDICWKHAPEVEIGPYLLDFAGVLEGEAEVHPKWNEDRPQTSLVQCCVALEADGPSHFYRPHGRPWHWTSMSKLRHRLLSGAGVRVAHVPYYDWAELSSQDEKEEYLVQLILAAQRSRFKPRTKPDDGRHAPRPTAE